jgi:mycothiol synthase
MLVRPYRAHDEGGLLELWNETMQVDPVNPATFRTQVLLDPNFRPEGLLLAEEQGQLAGFVLAVYRQTPLFQQGLEPAWGGFGPSALRSSGGAGALAVN